MPGVVTTLRADDDVGLAGKHINDLALTLVTPLAPDNSINRHPTPISRIRAGIIRSSC